MTARVLTLSHLYHVTALNLEDADTEANYSERPECYPHWVCPEPGQFSTNLQDHKWFTITPASSYADVSPEERWAFLRYTVKRPLRLLDVRLHGEGSTEYQSAREIHHPRYQELDGYVGRGTDDLTEVMLVRPYEVLDPEFTLLPYVPVNRQVATGPTMERLLRYENQLLGGGTEVEALFLPQEEWARFGPTVEPEFNSLHQACVKGELSLPGCSLQIPLAAKLLDMLLL